MTYKELLDKLTLLTEEQLAQNVQILSSKEDINGLGLIVDINTLEYFITDTDGNLPKESELHQFRSYKDEIYHGNFIVLLNCEIPERVI